MADERRINCVRCPSLQMKYQGGGERGLKCCGIWGGMGAGKREAGNQKMEGSVGGKTTAMEKNKWLDDHFASFRYTGGRSKVSPPPPADASSSSSPPPVKPLNSSATPASAACAVRHPTLAPRPRTPPSRSNPKPTASLPPSQRNQKASTPVLAVRPQQRPSPVRMTVDADSPLPPSAHDEETEEEEEEAGKKKKRHAPSKRSTRKSNRLINSRKRKTDEAEEEMGTVQQKNKHAKNNQQGRRGKIIKDDDEDVAMQTLKPRTTLPAAEKQPDPYRRLTESSKWIPPPGCPIRLLQEGHYFDPWRVLVICILLNRTQGSQVERMLDDFFELCPNAEAAKDVRDEALTELIRPLGLYRKRTKDIKKFSREYLDSEWTNVNQLHCVGKYAADAYAIFCVGEPEKVTPDDHKLVPYWMFLCEMGRHKEKRE